MVAIDEIHYYGIFEEEPFLVNICHGCDVEINFNKLHCRFELTFNTAKAYFVFSAFFEVYLNEKELTYSA